ncbi:MAG: hypothetical protein A3F14_01365 [Gammaproteobacteria bacterium RIFCSPHIGHO2_12_FULL_43_28]|nr:MAG: hypothetical protein A3F14_01365 [Gammaproteobacteria bacterium RIFCSPHIGHO2_12_FULL_43_28]
MQKLLNRLAPFFFIGIALVAFAFGIILLSYLFLIGALVGLLLFIVTSLRNRFFPPKKPAKPKRQGRIIDSDDWRKL